MGTKLKDLEKLDLLIYDSICKCYCQPQRTRSFSCCPHVSSCDLLQWVSANAFHFAELRVTKSLLLCLLSLLDPFSPIPKQKPSSSFKFCRLDAQLCMLASHYWLKKIIKDRKRHNTLDRMIMQYWLSALGQEGSFALCLSPWNVTEICCINKPWMNSLILFCGYFKSFLPKAQAWFALPQPPAGKLCALQLVGFAACQSVFAVVGHQRLEIW